jgi:hypothetical protein
MAVVMLAGTSCALVVLLTVVRPAARTDRGGRR